MIIRDTYGGSNQLEPAMRAYSGTRHEASIRSSQLGRRLRELYRELENEPIPPDFEQLLRKLDAGDR